MILHLPYHLNHLISIHFTSSVYPFILKGITLYGIDYVDCPMNLILKIWDLLSNEWKLDDLDDMVNVY